MIRLDANSPECGWEPLMDWMVAVGYDPVATRSIEIDEASLIATFELFVVDDAGRKVTDENGEELATYTEVVALTEMPPRRSTYTVLDGNHG